VRSSAAVSLNQFQSRNVGFWHKADKPAVPVFVAYWTKSGQRAVGRLNGSAAIDPERTLAVRCGNGFDAGFSPYQITRLNRYDAVS